MSALLCLPGGRLPAWQGRNDAFELHLGSRVSGSGLADPDGERREVVVAGLMRGTFEHVLLEIAKPGVRAHRLRERALEPTVFDVLPEAVGTEQEHIASFDTPGLRGDAHLQILFAHAER